MRQSQLETNKMKSKVNKESPLQTVGRPSRKQLSKLPKMQASSTRIKQAQENKANDETKLPSQRPAEHNPMGALASQAIQYLHRHRYMSKMEDDSFQAIQICGDNQRLQRQGQGLKGYYIFYRVVLITALLMAGCSVGQLYFDLLGTGFIGVNSKVNIFQGYIALTTLGNNTELSQINFIVSTVMVCAAVVLILLATLVGRLLLARSRKIDYELGQSSSSERFAVRVSGFNNKYIDKEQLKETFEKFGPVASILLVRDTAGNLDSIVQYCQQKQLYQQMKSLEQQNSGHELVRLDCAVAKQEALGVRVGHPIFAYVEFEKQESKLQCLQTFKSHGLKDSIGARIARALNCCRSHLQDKYKCADLELRVTSTQIPEPEDIIVQNLDVWVSLRLLKGFLLFIAQAFLTSVCSILMVATLVAGRQTCAKIYTLAQAIVPQAKVAAFCYCSQNPSLLMVNSDPCASNFSEVMYEWWKLLVIACLAFAFNRFATGVAYFGGNWLRFQLNSSRLIYVVVSSLVFGLANTIIAPILITANIYSFKPSDGLLFFIRWFNIDTTGMLTFSDMGPLWLYFFSTYLVFFGLYNLAAPLLKFLGAVLSYCCRKQPVDNPTSSQSALNAASLYYKFHFDWDLSQLLVLLFTTTFAGHGLPILYVLLLLNVLLRYVVNNYVILRFSVKQPGLTPNFVVAMYRVLPLSTFLGCLFGCWILTANFPSRYTSTVSLFNFTTGGLQILNILSRWLQISYCWITAAAALVFFAVDILLWQCGCLFCCRALPSPEQTQTQTQDQHSSQHVVRQERRHYGLQDREGFRGVEKQVLRLQQQTMMSQAKKVSNSDAA